MLTPGRLSPSPVTRMIEVDTIREVLGFIASDERYGTIGMQGTVRGVLKRRLGVAPSEEMVAIVADAFWDACEECLGDA